MAKFLIIFLFEFRAILKTFYSPCFLGDHTKEVNEIEFRCEGGAALTCIDKKCLRVFFV